MNKQFVLLVLAISLTKSVFALEPVSEVEFLESSSSIPPTNETQWQVASLPYAPRDQPSPDFKTFTSLWFRVPTPEEGAVTQYIYIPRHNMTLDVYVDGSRIGGSPDAPFGMDRITWNEPFLLEIPQTSAPYIYLHVQGGPSGPLLGNVLIGNQNELAPLYETREFIQVRSSKWAFGVCAVLAVLSIWLWLKRRRDQMYLQFAVLSLLWCIVTSFGFLTFVPISMRFWLTVIHTAFDWSTYLLISYTLSAISLNLVWLKRMVFAGAVAGTITHLIAPDSWFLPLAYLCHSVESLGLVILTVIILFHTVTRRVDTHFWFSIAYIGTAALMLHDMHGVFIASNDEWAAGSNWMHLSLPLICMAYYAHLVSRFVGALNESEALNTSLEARVQSQTEELEANFAATRNLELQAAASEERARIYRDLHDDVGSKLISIMHQGGHASPLAKSALESLRASIYRANFGRQSLKDFFEDSTEEMSLRLTGVGIQFQHSVEIHDTYIISPESGYHISRMLREITSNTINHSQASALRFDVNASSEEVSIRLIDDGIGYEMNGNGIGGLRNILDRAAMIGAQVDAGKNQLGMEVRISVPLEEVQPSPQLQGN